MMGYAQQILNLQTMEITQGVADYNPVISLPSGIYKVIITTDTGKSNTISISK